jgi:hypothetical protein
MRLIPNTKEKVIIDNLPFSINGKMVRVAQIEEDWLYEVSRPQELISELSQRDKYNVDLFTFRQIIPNFFPTYKYYFEFENDAVITVHSYDHWFNNQIHPNARNKLKKAHKKGVRIKICQFSDDFLHEILDIYNESPIRQGKRFAHYGISFAALKKAHSTFLDKATYIGVYFNQEMIGFAKLVQTDNFIRTMGILTKGRHSDKAPMTLLISEAVRICESRSIKYFLYGRYDYGKIGSHSVRDFKKYNGFEGLLFPRYFVPLTVKGTIFKKFNLHNGISGITPEPIIRFYLKKRKEYYDRRI